MKQKSKNKIELSINGESIGKAYSADKSDYGRLGVYEVEEPFNQNLNKKYEEELTKMFRTYKKVEPVKYRKDIYTSRIKKHSRLYLKSDGTLLLIMANVSNLYNQLCYALTKCGESVDKYHFYWAPIYDDDDKYPTFEYDFVWIEEK